MKKFIGTLVATDWNIYEEPIEFSLRLMDGRYLLLESQHLKKRCLKLLDKPVVVMGVTRKNEFGRLYIDVKKMKRRKLASFISSNESFLYDFSTPLNKISESHLR